MTGRELPGELLHEKHPEIRAEYIECGKVYRYTDSPGVLHQGGIGS